MQKLSHQESTILSLLMLALWEQLVKKSLSDTNMKKRYRKYVNVFIQGPLEKQYRSQTKQKSHSSC